eukprot:3864342-Rhodomonas_salina.2
MMFVSVLGITELNRRQRRRRPGTNHSFLLSTSLASHEAASERNEFRIRGLSMFGPVTSMSGLVLAWPWHEHHTLDHRDD